MQVLFRYAFRSPHRIYREYLRLRSGLLCFLRDGNRSVEIIVPRSTSALSPVSVPNTRLIARAGTSRANAPFIHFICETLEDYRKSSLSRLKYINPSDLCTIIKAAVNFTFRLPTPRLGVKFIYRVHELHLRSQNTSYAISSRAGRYFRRGNIQLRVSVFSNPILVTCVRAPVRGVLEGILISEFLGIYFIVHLSRIFFIYFFFFVIRGLGNAMIR